MGLILDLSKWQGDVDFTKLKGQVDFVVLRVQCGSTNPDPLYNTYVTGCKANGIPFGTYAYFLGLNVNDAIQEAKDALSRTDKASQFFAVDVEEQTCTVATDLIPSVQAYVDYLHQQGITKVGLYSGDYFFRNYNLVGVNVDFHWIANYGVNDGLPHILPSSPNDLWQYTSVGNIDGVSGNVDESKLTGTKPLDYFTGTAPIPATPPAPKPTGVVTVVTDLLNLRMAPSTSAGIFRTLKKGEQYHFFDIQNGWYDLGGPHSWAYGNNGQYLKEGIPTPVPQPVFHTVVSGDTVSALASKYGSTLAQIKAWNGLNANYTIYVGKSIRVK